MQFREFAFLPHVHPGPSSLNVPSPLTPNRVQPQASPQLSQLSQMSVAFRFKLDFLGASLGQLIVQ